MKIAVAISFVFLFLFALYLGQRIGASRSESIWLGAETVALEKFQQCYDEQDFECMDKILEVQYLLRKTRLDALLERGLFVEHRDELKRHQKWLMEHQPKT